MYSRQILCNNNTILNAIEAYFRKKAAYQINI